MKKIIEEVFQAEERVNEILKQARGKASEIKHSAEKEISEKMSDAKQKTREIIQTTAENAKIEAKRIREETLEQADRQRDTLLNNKTDAIENLVDDICSIILTTEHEKGNQ